MLKSLFPLLYVYDVRVKYGLNPTEFAILELLFHQGPPPIQKIVSGDGDEHFPIQIHADIHAYATEIKAGQDLSFAVDAGCQAYLVLIEGSANIGGHQLTEWDALEITEETIQIQAHDNAHILLIEMAKKQQKNSSGRGKSSRMIAGS